MPLPLLPLPARSRCSRSPFQLPPLSALLPFPCSAGFLRGHPQFPLRSPLRAPATPAPAPGPLPRRIFDAPSRITAITRPRTCLHSNADMPDAGPPLFSSGGAPLLWLPAARAFSVASAASLMFDVHQGRPRPPNSGAQIFSLEAGAITIVGRASRTPPSTPAQFWPARVFSVASGAITRLGNAIT
ncbi:hypothetical protein B0H11DRAFT_2262226 [Mycena galericulata]|nr:hypothetical protein B0H11DRAFT_2262226 [Mycena galericulata]